MDTIYHADTIVAPTTPPGEGGVSMVRVSGPEALAIADAVFRCAAPLPSQRQSHTVVYGHVTDAEGYPLDEVLLLIMRGPRSYTCEDVVEFHGHGGLVCSRRILRRIVEAGARMAEPGEFTRRAFLNGRIDLVQAEAVMDLVRSQSDRAGMAALEQLRGSLSDAFGRLYDDTMEVAARLEATLDFPEDELPAGVLDKVCDGLREAERSAENLLATWEEGHLLRDGAVVVISGRPNAGKSTLLNALLGKNRAIVSATPGTTRDSIEETLVLSGIPLRLVDTAGLRDTDCDIERQGIDRARSHMNEADLHVVVIDATLPPDPEECALVSGLPAGRRIVLLNKCELTGAIDAYPVEGVPVIRASLRDGVGLDRLRETMTELLGGRCDLAARPHGVVSERHRHQLVEALDEIRQARQWMAGGGEGGIVPAASHLRAALDTLGHITGKTYQDSLLDAIFSRFCIGK